MKNTGYYFNGRKSEYLKIEHSVQIVNQKKKKILKLEM